MDSVLLKRKDIQSHRTDSGKNAGFLSNATSILAKSNVSDVMQTIFNSPMTEIATEESAASIIAVQI
jgi:hypothetical protein